MIVGYTRDSCKDGYPDIVAGQINRIGRLLLY